MAPGHGVRPGIPFWVPHKPDAKVGAAEATADTERARDRRLYYELTATESYLFSHVRESLEEYKDRVARAMHYPLYRSIVDIYVSAVLRTDAGREGDKTWEAYWADVDQTGAQIDVFMRTALTYALVYGRVHAVTDAPEGGGRPYTYLIPPSDLVDWRLDTRGSFLWAVVREDYSPDRMPGFECTKPQNQYRVWTREGWALWRKVDKEWKPVRSGKHSAKKVPIDTLFARRGYESRRTLEADCVLDDIVDIDRAVFNLVSLLHDQIYAQCFSQLAIPTESGEAPDLELGLKRVLGFLAEAGGARPMYLSPNSDLINVQVKIIGEHMGWARTLANVGRGRAEFSKEERSAASLQAEGGDKNNAVSSLAGAVEAFDRAVHGTVASMRGLGKAPKAVYPRDVSQKALSAQIADATSLQALNLPGAVLAVIVKPLVTRILREHGQSNEEIAKAIAAIDAGVTEFEAPDAVAPAPMPEQLAI